MPEEMKSTQVAAMENSIPHRPSRTIPPENDRFVRPKEAVRITGRSLASQNRDRRAGKWVPIYRIGDNSIAFLLSDLLALNASREIVTAESTRPVAIPKTGKKRGRPRKVTNVCVEG